jgi:hypothetical protein
MVEEVVEVLLILVLLLHVLCLWALRRMEQVLVLVLLKTGTVLLQWRRAHSPRAY